MLDRVERTRRGTLSHHEQMIDAMGQCVPCKLCGGAAVIEDAGSGWGYTIRCENARELSRHSKGCMLHSVRLSGWAYNVMEWWNRLHAVGKSRWLNYDHQAGRWCVTEEPPTVVRPDSEIIHVVEVSVEQA